MQKIWLVVLALAILWALGIGGKAHAEGVDIRAAEFKPVLAFLADRGCYPDHNLVLLYNGNLDGLGSYKNGAIEYRTADHGVMVHELWHHCQFLAHGSAKSAEENETREWEARKIEMQWRRESM